MRNEGVLPLWNIQTILRRIPSSLFLFLGLFFSNATKFRFPGLPLGFSEIFFLIFAFSGFIKDEFDWRSKTYMKFLKISFFCLLIANTGAFYNFFQDISYYLFLHDNFAFIYVILISYLILTYKHSLETGFRNLILITLLIAVACSFLDHLGDLSFFYSSRFSFISQNPNQFALFLTPLPFFIFHFICLDVKNNNEENNWIWWLAFFCCVYLALRTLSFTVFFSWGIIVLCTIAWFARIMITKYKLNEIFWYYLLFITFTVSACVVYFLLSFLERDVPKSVCELQPINREVYIHFDILKSAIQKIINGGFVFGYGPGALLNYSGIHNNEILTSYSPSSIDSLYGLYYEPHNILLGIAFQGGLISLFAAVYGLYITGKKIVDREQIFLFLGLFSLILFSVFHGPIRMPFLWFFLIYLYKYNKDNKEINNVRPL